MNKGRHRKAIIILVVLLSIVRLVYINFIKEYDTYERRSVNETISLGKKKYFKILEYGLLKDSGSIEGMDIAPSAVELLKFKVETNVEELMVDYSFKLNDQAQGLYYLSDPDENNQYTVVVKIDKGYIRYLKDKHQKMMFYYLIHPYPPEREQEKIQYVPIDLAPLL